MVVFSIGAIVTALGGVLKFADNKITSYFLVLAVLLLDATQGSLLGNAGIIGSFFHFVIASLSGVSLNIQTIHLLFLFALAPVIWFVLSKSGRR